jgi:hypothetical protein
VHGAAIDHPDHREEDAAYGAYLTAVAIANGRDRVIVAEQLVGAVDEINVQG